MVVFSSTPMTADSYLLANTDLRSYTDLSKKVRIRMILKFTIRLFTLQKKSS